MLKVSDIREYFINELKDEIFTVDKTGQKTIEMIGASFIADEEAIFGKPSAEYIGREIEWYLSGSTNINDIYNGKKEPPKAWQYTANEHGEINSNYGYLIYDPLFYNQFDNVKKELLHNPDSRRGIMIYNRPSIWEEFCENGKNDFICTNAVCYYIRDGYLETVVQMRSNDVIFGYKNDWAWQRYVQQMMCNELNLSLDRMFDRDILPGNIYWQVQNLHVYERHFHLVRQ